MAQTIFVKAPVDGVVGDVRVNEGDAISQGGLLVIQTMAKAETQVAAPVAGRIKVIARKGAALAEGDVIAEIEY